jgi:hypothetical protein
MMWNRPERAVGSELRKALFDERCALDSSFLAPFQGVGEASGRAKLLSRPFAKNLKTGSPGGSPYRRSAARCGTFEHEHEDDDEFSDFGFSG